MKEIIKIKKIAKDTRHWTEQYEEKNKTAFDPDTLGGLCSISSYEMFKRLKEANLDAEFCSAPGHVFVICKEYLIDVTATQFDIRKPVVIKKLRPQKDRPLYWQETKRFRSKEEIVLDMCNNNWPEDQIHPDLKSIIKEIKFRDNRCH